MQYVRTGICVSLCQQVLLGNQTPKLRPTQGPIMIVTDISFEKRDFIKKTLRLKQQKRQFSNNLRIQPQQNLRQWLRKLVNLNVNSKFLKR